MSFRANARNLFLHSSVLGSILFQTYVGRAVFVALSFMKKTFSPLSVCLTLKTAQILFKMKNFAVFRKKRRESFVCNEKVHTLVGQQ